MAERIDNDTVAIPVERYNRWKEIVKGHRSGKTIFTVSHMRTDGTEIKEVDYKGKDAFISGMKDDWNKWYTEVSSKFKELDSLKVELANTKQELSIVASSLSSKSSELTRTQAELKKIKEKYEKLLSMDAISFTVMKRKMKKELRNGINN